MTITRLDPADSVAMGQWYDLMVAVTRQDLPDFPTPSQQEHTARFEQPWPALTEERLLAWRGDRVVGATSYLLPPLLLHGGPARRDRSDRPRTKLSFEANDHTHARQRVTIVEPAHRGRRLGLIMKSANHAYTQAHKPALRVIDA